MYPTPSGWEDTETASLSQFGHRNHSRSVPRCARSTASVSRRSSCPLPPSRSVRPSRSARPLRPDRPGCRLPCAPRRGCRMRTTALTSVGTPGGASGGPRNRSRSLTTVALGRLETLGTQPTSAAPTTVVHPTRRSTLPARGSSPVSNPKCRTSDRGSPSRSRTTTPNRAEPRPLSLCFPDRIRSRDPNVQWSGHFVRRFILYIGWLYDFSQVDNTKAKSDRVS